MEEYYVYEWIRLDTNEPFYIGKGKNDRWSILTRGNNYHFNNIVKNIPTAVVILEDNLDEKTAYEYEIFYINEYKNLGYNLVNILDGGLGGTICGKNHHWYGISTRGILNPMFGRKHSEDTKKKISISRTGVLCGVEHPFWTGGGIDYKCKMCNKDANTNKHAYYKYKEHFCSKECYDMWQKESGIVIGSNNPNYKGFIVIFKDGSVTDVMTRDCILEMLHISKNILNKLVKSKKEYIPDKRFIKKEPYKSLCGIRILKHSDYLIEVGDLNVA